MHRMAALRSRSRALILASTTLLGLAACAPTSTTSAPGAAQPVSATLPPDAVVGAGDPTRAAILNTAYAFASPANLTGRPADAAQAVANYEYLTVEIPNGPRWREFPQTIPQQLAAGRGELRNAVGIAPNAPPQAVIDSLYAASRAIRAGDRTAAERILSGPIFPTGGTATLQRLASLPPVPLANIATSNTQAALTQMDRQGRDQDGPGGGGRL